VLRALVKFSIEQRLFVIGLVMLVLGAGLWSASTLPIDAFPDLTNNQVVIITEAPGMAAPEVEQLVTFPLESTMMGIPDTVQVRSISKFGLSLITIVFADDVDIYFARQLVNERLQEAMSRIPEGLEATLGPVATAFGEIYQYVVEGEGYTAMELKTLHDWEIKYQLRTVPGVSEVNSWGGFIRQYHVLVEPERLLAFGLSLRDVFEALANSNQNFGGSYIEHGAEAYTVRGLGLFRGERDIEEVVVRAGEGVPVQVKHLAEVRIEPAIRQGAVTKDAHGEVVSGMVIMTKGENSKAVIERVKRRVEEIERTLPEGVTIDPFYDQTTLVNRTSRTVATNLVEGGLLVIIVLFLFLHNVRAALVVASVIPLSMLIAFIGMRVFGVSANLMSLGAIDFGLIVDGAVVMVENFVRRLRLRRSASTSNDSVSYLIRESTLEVARPIVFGVSIIMAVYLPIFALEGMSARMFRPMALTVVMAIFGSLVLALTFVPAVASFVCRFSDGESREPRFDRLRARYRRALENAVESRGITLGIAFGLVALAVASLPFMGTEFMPELDEGALLIETRRLPSVSLRESVEMATEVEEVVREFPEVETVVTKIGRPDLATEAMGIYQGDVYVILKPRSEWKTAGTKEELIEQMGRKLSAVPGIAYNFTQPLAMRLDEVISGVRSDVAVKLFGGDFDSLQRQAERVQRVLQEIPGAADVQIETLGGATELHIEVNRPELARYGLRVGDVGEFIETAVGGRAATQVIDGRRRFDVVVRLPEARRSDVEAIRSLLVPTEGGERVALGHLSRIRAAEGPEVINREDAQRRIVIQSNVRGRDIGSFVAEAQAAIDRLVELPVGYYVTWGGEFENQQEAMRRLAVVLPLAILIIFVLLFANFDSLALSLLIMVNLPLALVGGVGALWLRGLHLSLSASVGFIALFGIAVLNGLVMVSHINHLREEGRGLHEAVIDGATVRLRPVLMTALVASLGFVPMATSTQPGAEVQRPLATVVIGGLVTSTLLTLFVLPTLYHWMEEKAFARRRRAGSSRETALSGVSPDAV
jgi:cobalt-zinc-cadmium resistance protein CzcA